MRFARLRTRKLAERALDKVSSSLQLQWLLSGLVDKLAFVQSVYGPLLYNSPDDRTFELCLTGYGRFVSDAIESWKGDFLFLDFGANLGLFSLIAARNPHCRQVIAFEPLPLAFRRLELNMARNGATKILPVEGAVTNSAVKEVYLTFNSKHTGMSKMTKDKRGAVRAAAISPPDLNLLVPRGQVPILAKIDVEGRELDVWLVLKGTHFYERIKGLLVEISERNSDAATRQNLFATLEADGFEEVGRDGDPEHYDALYRRSAKSW